jgi:hypothetical protein
MYIYSMFYVACWTEDDGIYSCGHGHGSVQDAMLCLVPDGRTFIRACESGVSRSLNEHEFAAFLIGLSEMPWRSSVWSDERGD